MQSRPFARCTSEGLRSSFSAGTGLSTAEMLISAGTMEGSRDVSVFVNESFGCSFVGLDVFGGSGSD